MFHATSLKKTSKMVGLPVQTKYIAPLTATTFIMQHFLSPVLSGLMSHPVTKFSPGVTNTDIEVTRQDFYLIALALFGIGMLEYI